MPTSVSLSLTVWPWAGRISYLGLLLLLNIYSDFTSCAEVMGMTAFKVEGTACP